MNKSRVRGWTDARFFDFLRSALRAAWVNYPNRYYALNAASRKSQLTDKRTKKEYQCKECLSWHKQKGVQVDHITPVGTLRSFGDLAGFASRLFCKIEGLRVLCKPCHSIITYMSSSGLSFKEAKMTKEVIRLAGQPIPQQKQQLREGGYNETQISNDEKRKACFMEVLSGK